MELTLGPVYEDEIVLYERTRDGKHENTRIISKEMGVKVLALNGLINVRLLLSHQAAILPCERQNISKAIFEITKFQMIFLLESVKVCLNSIPFGTDCDLNLLTSY